jgi:hypothetical protein
MNPIEKQATERLAAAGRVKDRSLRMAWVSLLLALFLLLLLAVALADYWLMLPTWARFGGLVALAGLTAAGLVRARRLLVRATSLKEAALDAEAQYPALGCMVSTAAEYLSGQRKITQEYEPQLVAALEQEAAKAMARARVPYMKKLRMPLALLAGALLVMAGFFLFSSAPNTALQRITSPWTPVTYTVVQVKPGDTEVPMGKDLEIRAEFTGRLPKNPQFQWRELGATNWHKNVLGTNETAQCTNVVKDVRHPFLYRITGGDAASMEYRVVPYIPPEVQELKIQTVLPAYTGRAPLQQAAPDLTVLRASTSTFKVRPNVRLKSAVLRFDKLPPVELVKEGEDIWTGAITVSTNANYWIELTDERKHVGTNAVAYHIKALPDKPPKVEITEPGQDMRAQATNTVPLKISVTDDYGVADIKVHYHKLGQPEQTMEVSGRKLVKGEVRATASLSLTELELKDYEVVAYYAQAEDNNTLDGPGVGKSKVYFIEITHEKPPSNPRKGQPTQPPPKVNLLVIQKQVIADTKELAKNAASEQTQELSERQKAAAEFADIYRETMPMMGAPTEAVKHMDDAYNDMMKASADLEKGQPDQALPKEESALAHMYQALKLMPELQDLPTQPSPPTPGEKNPPSKLVKVVMEAIKKKKEAGDPKELTELADQIAQLSQAQAALNEALKDLPGQEREDQGEAGKPTDPKDAKSGKQPGEKSPGEKSPGEKSPSDQAGQESPGQAPGDQAQGEQDPNQKADAKGKGKGDKPSPEKSKKGQKGKGKGKGDKAGEKPENGDPQAPGDQGGKPGDKPGEKQDGKQPGEQEGKAPGEQGQGPSPEELAKQQEELGKQGDELSQKLAKLAGKDVRLGHNLSKSMSQAVSQIKSAAQSLKGGMPGQGVSQAKEGGYGLNTVASKLEKIVETDKQLTDTSSEDFPKEYETAIRDYLKRLSHQE